VGDHGQNPSGHWVFTLHKHMTQRRHGLKRFSIHRSGTFKIEEGLM
jgi:hypothetical protein